MANPFGKMPGGMGSMGNLGKIMEQVQKAAADAQKVDAELSGARVETQSGGGLVRVVATGKAEIVEIKISRDVVDPDDVETLEDLVTVAVREAIEKANAMREERLRGVMPPGMGDQLPGGLF